MITQIEIDGFKSFKDFKVELAPFQVIVGPNGSGKSNLFDALHLLSRLAETDLLSAFQPSHDDQQKQRGDVYELFTTLPNGQRSDRIRMAVEVLVDRKVRDSLGKEAKLTYRRLRYELEVAFRINEHGLDRVQVKHESLISISQYEDSWSKKYGLLSQNNWLPKHSVDPTAFITTQAVDLGSTVLHPNPMITLHSEGPEGQGVGQIFWAEKVQRTILSSVTVAILPHVFAVREEMRSWKFLHLNPELLRKPSAITAPSSLSEDGDNLPTTLARMQAEDEFALGDVSLDMANLVPGILNIEIDEDKARNQYVVRAKDSDGRSFSAQVLSDGTLRLLTLATLRNDLQFHGVLCLEEPENGVHPLRLRKMARLLREMATDFKDEQQVDEPLRQVLITTHSPAFISQPEVIDSLLFAYTVMRVEPLASGNPSLEITCMTPVITSETQLQHRTDTNRDETMEVYTIDQVIKYLSSESLDKARDQLDNVRASLSEG